MNPNRRKRAAKLINRLAADKLPCTKSYTDIARLARALEYVRDWLLQSDYIDTVNDMFLYELAVEKLSTWYVASN